MNAISHAQSLDRADPLAAFRSQFFIPSGTIYLNGNSLGLLSKPSEAAVLGVLGQWKALAGSAWLDPGDPWFDLSERISAHLAPMIGAQASEVMVTGSTTVNLHQLLATFYQPESGRPTILYDQLAFPSDAYAIQSHLALRGASAASHGLVMGSRDSATLHEGDIEDFLARPDVGMAILPAVVYGSGQLIDMPRVTRAAAKHRVTIGWDCSHAIGAVPLDFGALDADFAFWCHYKYMNGGPGAVGGLWVNRRHLNKSPGLTGWFGSDKSRQFLMQHLFEPAAGAGRFQLGSPHLLSLAALRGSLTLFEQAGMDRLRAKSLGMTQFLMENIDQRLAQHGVRVITPKEPARRGGHVSLHHPRAQEICKSLAGRGVITDYRKGDVLRITPAAMYNTFEECFRAIEAIDSVLGG